MSLRDLRCSGPAASSTSDASTDAGTGTGAVCAVAQSLTPIPRATAATVQLARQRFPQHICYNRAHFYSPPQTAKCPLRELPFNVHNKKASLSTSRPPGMPFGPFASPNSLHLRLRRWRAPIAQRRLRLLENLREEIPRRGRTPNVHRLPPRRLLDETQRAVPSQIVEHKLQALPLAGRKPGRGKVEHLSAGVVQHPRALHTVRGTALGLGKN